MGDSLAEEVEERFVDVRDGWGRVRLTDGVEVSQEVGRLLPRSCRRVQVGRIQVGGEPRVVAPTQVDVGRQRELS